MQINHFKRPFPKIEDQGKFQGVRGPLGALEIERISVTGVIIARRAELPKEFAANPNAGHLSGDVILSTPTDLLNRRVARFCEI